MIRTTRNTVHAWAHAEPDEISKRFHNRLLREWSTWPELRHLLDLFAEPAPPRTGPYWHHDGCRS